MATLCLTVNAGDPPLGKEPRHPTYVGCISRGGCGAGKVAAPGVAQWRSRCGIRPAGSPKLHGVSLAPLVLRPLACGSAPGDSFLGRGGRRVVSPGRATRRSVSDLFSKRDDSQPNPLSLFEVAFPRDLELLVEISF